MPGAELPKPEIAGDVLRIHRLITRALRVSVDESAAFARDGYPDAAHRQGLIAYVRRLATLLREEKLVKVSEDLVFHSKAIRDLTVLVAGHKGERFRVPRFKEWTGISRKYAIPLLEYLDRQRVTRREGDERVVN